MDMKGHISQNMSLGASSTSTTNEDEANHINRVFETVPAHEIQQLIWNRLDLASKRNCRLVCKQWEEGANESLHFNPVLSDATADVVKNSTKPFYKLEVCDLGKFQYPKDGFGLKGLNKLILRTNNNANNGEWSQGNWESFDSLQDLFEECKDLKSLEVWGRCLSAEWLSRLDFQYRMKELALNNLENLQISADNNPGFRFASELLNNTFPNLRAIDLGFYTSRRGSKNQRVYTDPFHAEIFSFIGRHSKTLQDVSIFREDILDSEGLEIRLDEMDAGVETEIIEQLKLVQLSTFEYHCNQCDLISEFASELFKVQRKLIKIHLRNTVGQVGLMHFLPQVCQQCLETLEEVTIEGFLEGLEEGATLSCSFLANCSKLETFRLLLEMFEGESLSGLEYLPKQIKNFEFDSADVTLTVDQVYFVAEELINLETFTLTQMKWTFGDQKVDLLIFKKVLGMPRLRKLVLDLKTSDYKSISGWISDHGQECVKVKSDFERYDTYTVTIDRRNFDSSRI